MNAETLIKAFVALVGLAGFLFGIVQFVSVRAIEAEKPYLERKLAWCEEAVETTAKIATASYVGNEAATKDVARFWQLYWGVMGLIEKDSITNAMVAFGEALGTGDPATDGAKSDPDSIGLSRKSLDLAHACRAELSKEWSPSWAR